MASQVFSSAGLPMISHTFSNRRGDAAECDIVVGASVPSLPLIPVPPVAGAVQQEPKLELHLRLPTAICCASR
jgi:hypothetical protein